MKRTASLLVLLLLVNDAGWAARCTTAVDTRVLEEYEHYVRNAEQSMAERFTKGFASTAGDDRNRLLMDLQGGSAVRWNVTEESVNQRIAPVNGTVLDWVGAVRIRNSTISDLRSVLEDYGNCGAIYEPLMYDCHARKVDGGSAYDLAFGMQNVYRGATIFPQHYAFAVKARAEYLDESSRPELALRVHSRAYEIRESDSGVPGRSDLLEPYHDHGVLWGLNTYWRAKTDGPDLYVEFEAITLHRSVQEFMCKIGMIPVPKYLISRVMEALPGESIDVMLAGTKAETERRSARRSPRASRSQN
ncbi:MAG: hypothetical protein ABL995_13530 [Bryobacteraceae bacterium]